MSAAIFFLALIGLFGYLSGEQWIMWLSILAIVFWILVKIFSGTWGAVKFTGQALSYGTMDEMEKQEPSPVSGELIGEAFKEIGKKAGDQVFYGPERRWQMFPWHKKLFGAVNEFVSKFSALMEGKGGGGGHEEHGGAHGAGHDAHGGKEKHGAHGEGHGKSHGGGHGGHEKKKKKGHGGHGGE